MRSSTTRLAWLLLMLGGCAGEQPASAPQGIIPPPAIAAMAADDRADAPMPGLRLPIGAGPTLRSPLPAPSPEMLAEGISRPPEIPPIEVGLRAGVVAVAGEADLLAPPGLLTRAWPETLPQDKAHLERQLKAASTGSWERELSSTVARVDQARVRWVGLANDDLRRAEVAEWTDRIEAATDGEAMRDAALDVAERNGRRWVGRRIAPQRENLASVRELVVERRMTFDSDALGRAFGRIAPHHDTEDAQLPVEIGLAVDLDAGAPPSPPPATRGAPASRFRSGQLQQLGRALTDTLVGLREDPDLDPDLRMRVGNSFRIDDNWSISAGMGMASAAEIATGDQGGAMERLALDAGLRYDISQNLSLKSDYRYGEGGDASFARVAETSSDDRREPLHYASLRLIWRFHSFAVMPSATAAPPRARVSTRAAAGGEGPVSEGR